MYALLHLITSVAMLAIAFGILLLAYRQVPKKPPTFQSPGKHGLVPYIMVYDERGDGYSLERVLLEANLWRTITDDAFGPNPSHPQLRAVLQDWAARNITDPTEGL